MTRSSARRANPVDSLPEKAAPVDNEPDDDLTEALARLPVKQKQSVAYHYLGGLPYVEVAAILGGTPEAARRAAADGIATLRRTYSSTGGTAGNTPLTRHQSARTTSTKGDIR